MSKTSLQKYSTAYWRMRPFWVDAINLLEPIPSGYGPGGTLGLYLKRYSKEDDDEFAARCARIAQVNFVNMVVDFYCSMLFSTDQIIKSEKYQEEVASFVSSCNTAGDNLKDYFREVIAPNALTYGISDVFVDLNSVESTEELSVYQADEMGLNSPYCYIVPPINRVAWSLDEGRQWESYRSMDVLNTQVSSSMQIKDKHQYNDWTKDRVTVYTQGGDVISEKDNPYGFIPAVSVIPIPSVRYYDDRLGVSLIQDIIPLQKLVINLLSLILDFHENVNFAMRVLIQDTGGGDDPPSQQELAEGGNKRGMILKGSQSDFKIVTPPAEGVVAMNDFLNDIIGRIFQSALIPSDANTNKTHQSGATIRNNLAQLYNRLTRISKHFEKSMKGIVDMALRVQGIDPAEAKVTVQWDTNFSYDSFIVSISQLTALREAVGDISKKCIGEYAKKVVGPQLYNSPSIGEIEKQIDDWANSIEEVDDNNDDDNKEEKPSLSQINAEVKNANKVEEEQIKEGETID